MRTAHPAPSHAEYSETKYFPCFDGMRALLTFWVVCRHCPRFNIPFLDAIQGAGDLSLDVFFVMSGFLITTLILRERPSSLGSRLKRFYTRRSLRIFPVYYVAIPLYLVVAMFATNPTALSRYVDFVPSFCFYYTDVKLAYSPDQFPWFGHTWSLAVEEKYYLLWPLVVMTVSARRALYVCMLCIVLGICIRYYVILNYSGEALEGRLYYGFDTRFDTIMWGSMLGILLNWKRPYDFIVKITSPTITYLSAIGLVVFGVMADNSTQLRYIGAPILGTLALASLLTYPRFPGSKGLNHRWMIFIGRISYGIYLFHPVCLKTIEIAVGGDHGWRAPFIFVVGGSASVLTAWVSYRFFESWFLKKKAKFA